jgi:hypothetical protein
MNDFLLDGDPLDFLLAFLQGRILYMQSFFARGCSVVGGFYAGPNSEARRGFLSDGSIRA